MDKNFNKEEMRELLKKNSSSPVFLLKDKDTDIIVTSEKCDAYIALSQKDCIDFLMRAKKQSLYKIEPIDGSIDDKLKKIDSLFMDMSNELDDFPPVGGRLIGVVGHGFYEEDKKTAEERRGASPKVSKEAVTVEEPEKVKEVAQPDQEKDELEEFSTAEETAETETVADFPEAEPEETAKHEPEEQKEFKGFISDETPELPAMFTVPLNLEDDDEFKEIDDMPDDTPFFSLDDYEPTAEMTLPERKVSEEPVAEKDTSEQPKHKFQNIQKVLYDAAMESLMEGNTEDDQEETEKDNPADDNAQICDLLSKFQMFKDNSLIYKRTDEDMCSYFTEKPEKYDEEISFMDFLEDHNGDCGEHFEFVDGKKVKSANVSKAVLTAYSIRALSVQNVLEKLEKGQNFWYTGKKDITTAKYHKQFVLFDDEQKMDAFKEVFYPDGDYTKGHVREDRMLDMYRKIVDSPYIFFNCEEHCTNTAFFEAVEKFEENQKAKN